MVEALPQIPSISRLSPRVVRILGDNPSKFTLQGTNTYLVGGGRRRILIDTGDGTPSWAQSLKKVLADENAELSTVLLTHWHGDHVGGIEDVRALLRERQPASEVSFFKHRPAADQQDIRDGQSFSVEGATLRAFLCPGHTADHMAFVLAEEDAMFTGDNVLGHGTAVFEDLATYLQSLERMQDAFGGRAYPGHGAEIEKGTAKIHEYIAHRREREQQALDVLKGDAPNGDGEGWKSMSMVKVIYKQYPEHLHGPAEGGLLQVLKKLEKDGRVLKCGDGTWKSSKKAAL